MTGTRLAIVGASGYAGGEFIRLALGHPHLRVTQVTSREHARMPVEIVHPNLRGSTDLRFIHPDDLGAADVIVSALPHGRLAPLLGRFTTLAPTLLDLSADFRLSNPSAYLQHYGAEHPSPHLLGTFEYANPELNRERLRGATRIAAAGCIATAAILALYPACDAELVDRERDVIVEAKIGSSAAGSSPVLASHHPQRSGAVRTYAATRHRHLAEIEQSLPTAPRVHLTATAVERVRGVLVTAHLFLRDGVGEAQVMDALRERYESEPFVRIVRARRGVHRVPDPKILDGCNHCDVGFEFDATTGRLVMMAALDNLVKGTAGHALQALNIAQGWPEASGLSFTGLHP